MQNKKDVMLVSVSRRQKIFGIIALGGLFVCGVMIGLAFTPDKNPIAKLHNRRIEMSEYQCSSLVNKILSTNDAGQLKELTSAYEQNCAGRVIVDKEVKTNTNTEKLPAEPCVAIEKILEGRLLSNEDDCYANVENIDIYSKLIESGCTNNRAKYSQLRDRSGQIADTICSDFESGKYRNYTDDACSRLTRELLDRVCIECFGSEKHINNAKIYAIIAERGCLENRKKYENLAMQELEIARAVADDRLDERETIEVVETYKRLQMKQTAQEVLDKTKKIMDPTIDFILQVEKIINE